MSTEEIIGGQEYCPECDNMMMGVPAECWHCHPEKSPYFGKTSNDLAPKKKLKVRKSWKYLTCVPSKLKPDFWMFHTEKDIKKSVYKVSLATCFDTSDLDPTKTYRINGDTLEEAGE